MFHVPQNRAPALQCAGLSSSQASMVYSAPVVMTQAVLRQPLTYLDRRVCYRDDGTRDRCMLEGEAEGPSVVLEVSRVDLANVWNQCATCTLPLALSLDNSHATEMPSCTWEIVCAHKSNGSTKG